MKKKTKKRQQNLTQEEKLNTAPEADTTGSDIFDGDIKYGNIYHFKLNKDRIGLDLSGDLADKVASGEDGSEQTEFASGFGGITDIEIGPDGYMYVLVFDNEDGRIYRISPATPL